MNKKQIELVENSWDYVLMNSSDAGKLFYGRLFEIEPNLRHLFSSDISEQSKKLISLITFAVHKLNNLEEVTADVKALGMRHKNYKVKPEHYKIVGAALLWMLEKGLGDKWNEETKDAWLTLYGILSNIMIEAAEEVKV